MFHICGFLIFSTKNATNTRHLDCWKSLDNDAQAIRVITAVVEFRSLNFGKHTNHTFIVFVFTLKAPAKRIQNRGRAGALASVWASAAWDFTR